MEEGGFYRCKSNLMNNKEARIDRDITRLFILFHLFLFALYLHVPPCSCSRNCLSQTLLFWSESSRITRIAAHIPKSLAPQALIPFKHSAIFLIDACTSTSGAINRAFLIADFTLRYAGFHFGRVLLATTTGPSAGLRFVAAKEPPKQL